MGRDYVVIFGAAVRADGQPSGSLRRRVEGALDWWRLHPEVSFLPTGGIGRHGPAEAEVIRTMLVAAGVDPALILVEDRARDTLQSVLLCDGILRQAGDVGTLICCTSSYHQPRCKWLFQMLGYRVILPPMPSDRAWLPARKYWAFRGKELLSAPYDVIQLALGRGLLRATGGDEMTRNILIAGVILILLTLALYVFVFRPHPHTDNPVDQLADAAERMCLSNTSNSSTATLHAQLETIRHISATASAGTVRADTRGAVTTLSDALKAQQDDHIRVCMQPYTDRMLALIH